MFFRSHRQNNRPAAVSHGWSWVVSMTKNAGPTMELGMLSYIMERGKRFSLELDMVLLLCNYGRPWERLRPGAGKRFVALPYRSQKISSCDACWCMSAENLTSKSPIWNTSVVGCTGSRPIEVFIWKSCEPWQPEFGVPATESRLFQLLLRLKLNPRKRVLRASRLSWRCQL